MTSACAFFAVDLVNALEAWETIRKAGQAAHRLKCEDLVAATPAPKLLKSADSRFPLSSTLFGVLL
jgi:hypothetical protein